MKTSFQPYVYPGCQTTLIMLLAVLLLPRLALAECKEFRIVEYEDRVEAVCVGEPLTEAQKKANLEEEKRQEAASQRQRSDEQRRQREAAAATKAQEETSAAAERRKKGAQPGTPPKPVDRNLVTDRNFRR